MADNSTAQSGPVPSRNESPDRVLTTRDIQQKLEENAMLIEAIVQRQNINSLKECWEFQKKLEENLKQLAALADKQSSHRPNP